MRQNRENGWGVEPKSYTPRARLNPPNDDKAHSVVAMPAVLHCRSPCCKLTHIFKYPNDHVT